MSRRRLEAVVVDPDSLYEVDSDVPDLTGAVLLHHFDGYMDAGFAGRLLVEHLLEGREHRVVARFDVDGLIDYRSRRPVMTFVTDHWEGYQAPELVVHLLHDGVGTPFLLLTGPEPDSHWEAFTAAVRALVERWGLRLSVGFHGIPMAVPHTRPLGVSAHGTRAELVSDYRSFFDRVEVPGSAASLLELRLGAAGHDAIGFSAHVPHYLVQTTYPAAALTLLDSVARATGLALPEGVLPEKVRSVNTEIDRQVAESDEITQAVAGLERQYDLSIEDEERPSLLLEVAEHLPSADELGAEFERFLAEQQGHAGPQEH